MKLSVSLSDRSGEQLHQLLVEHNSNASAIVESAVRTCATIASANRERAVRETHASKKTLTRSGCRSTFWTVLAEELDAVDFAHGASQYSMAGRRHCGFDVVFLFDNIHDPEAGPLIVDVHTGTPWNDQTRHIGYRWTYQQEDSVFAAARAIAGWIREHEHEISSPSTAQTA